MFEKVNKSHPDKVADRIAGALVDLAYKRQENPKVAVEVLLGHGECTIIAETSAELGWLDAVRIVERITGKEMEVNFRRVPQDPHLADNQRRGVRCGDNGIFKGVPVTDEERELTRIAKAIYEKFPTDGKYILDHGRLTICQSNAREDEIRALLPDYPDAIVNPLGEWTGGPDVDSGATNRKLGSDMAQSATGGGPQGKDYSKADVSANIYAFLKAQETGKVVELSCSIGDDMIDGRPYSEIVDIARRYIQGLGGFEKFAEWGLVR